MASFHKIPSPKPIIFTEQNRRHIPIDRGKPLCYTEENPDLGGKGYEKSGLHQLGRIFHGHRHAGRPAEQGPQHPGGRLHRKPGQYHHLHRL